MQNEASQAVSVPTVSEGQLGVRVDANPRPFEFDAPFREVAIDATPNQTDESRKIIVYHRLSKPSKAQMVDHQNAQISESVSGGTNQQILTTDTNRADEKLWLDTVTHVKGYNFGNGVAVTEWQEVDEAKKAKIPVPHRTAAINVYYYGVAEPIEQEDVEAGFSLNTAFRFQLKIGNPEKPDYVVDFELKSPSESALRAFEQKRSRIAVVGQGRTAKTQSRLSYEAYRVYFKEIVVDVQGATVMKHPFTATANGNQMVKARWLDEIDTLWVIELVSAYQRVFQASRRD